MMDTVYVSRHTDENGNILGYVLKIKNGKAVRMSTAEIKNQIKGEKLVVHNLKLVNDELIEIEIEDKTDILQSKIDVYTSKLGILGEIPLPLRTDGKHIILTAGETLKNKRKIIVPPIVTKIDDEAFSTKFNRYGRLGWDLTSITGINVLEIGFKALAYCDHLVSIDFPNLRKIENYGLYTTYNGDFMQELKIPNIQVIGISAFESKRMKIREPLNLPNLRVIGEDAFRNSGGKLEINASENVRYGRQFGVEINGKEMMDRWE